MKSLRPLLAVEPARRLSIAIALVAVLSPCLGCSGQPLVKVKGQVVQGGMPVAPDPNRSYTVVFAPEFETPEPTSYSSVPVSDPNGEFEILGPDLRGIPTGRYRVTLNSMAPDPSQRWQALVKRLKTAGPVSVEVKDETPIMVEVPDAKAR